MPKATTQWGIVSTIKAPVETILNFAAWHLDQGAAHLFLYLDDDNRAAEAALSAHPRITATVTDAAHWQARLGRVPAKHQLRQCRNAEHAYGRAEDLHWLAHIDVDEFLFSPTPIAELLAALPAQARVARVRPEEVLSSEGQPDRRPGQVWCKGWVPPGKARDVVTGIYPTFGQFFRGGFLSHVAGKIFVRTGQQGIGFRIHDIFEDGARLSTDAELEKVALIHDHASDWDHWLAAYRYRHQKGSYRAEMKGAIPAEQGGLTPHQLLATLEAEEGEAGLRAFFDEMCLATPGLRARLDAHGLLRSYPLDLSEARQRHFPA